MSDAMSDRIHEIIFESSRRIEELGDAHGCEASAEIAEHRGRIWAAAQILGARDERVLVLRPAPAGHAADCSLVTTHHLTCTCGALSQRVVGGV